MKIVEYRSSQRRCLIAFCIVDDIETYSTPWIKETIKNLADFTISNLYTKGYDVFVGRNEDELLQHVTEYSHAVIMSPGTEYVNGFNFFNALESLVQKNFFIAGHILDRNEYDAYYELHHQCYVINMSYYKSFNCPVVGVMEKNINHTQADPVRSTENWHDNYTPKYILPGTQKKTYKNKCHGWNLLQLAFEHKLPVLVFDEDIRNNKKHYYPESKIDFEEKVSWLYFRYNYCATEFVHTSNNEWSNNINGKFDQLIIPASGTLYLDLIDKGHVIFYDYNKKSLEYWRKNCLRKKHVSYSFIHLDLLTDHNLIDYIKKDANKTFINLSNIFCYEGTATIYPLVYRLKKEQDLLLKLKSISNLTVNFTMQAACGFSNMETPSMSDLKKPTWHLQDWF